MLFYLPKQEILNNAVCLRNTEKLAYNIFSKNVPSNSFKSNLFEIRYFGTK